MGCGTSVFENNARCSSGVNVSHPRHGFLRANGHFISDAVSVQEFAHVAVSHHVKLASDRHRQSINRDIEIQQVDILWDLKKKLFPNLSALKPYDDRAVRTPPQLDNDPTSLVQYLTQGIQDDATKARVLAMWIASHIKYDTTLDSKNQNINDVSTVLKTKRSLCGGYSRVFEHFCNLVNVKCKYVSGLAKSGNFEPTAKFNVNVITGQLTKSDLHEHAWNILLVDNHWHMVDLTWSAGTIGDIKDGGNGEFQFKWQEEWFFSEPYSFIFTHFPYKNRMTAISRQNLSKPMSVHNWINSAVFTSVFFDYGLQAVSHSDLWIHADEQNRAEIQLNTSNDMNFYCKLSKNNQMYKDFCFVSNNSGVVTIRVHLPENGNFKFELWASLVFAEENLKDVKLMCIFGIEGKGKHRNEPFPKGAWPYWGPTYVLRHLGIEPLSHLEPTVKPNDDCSLEMIFKNKYPRRTAPQLMFTLHKNDDINSLKGQFCGWVSGREVRVKVVLLEVGFYRFTIFSKSKNRIEWNRAANYLIDASQMKSEKQQTFVEYFPEWSHLLGPTEQLSRLGMKTLQTNGWIYAQDGKIELQFHLEKPVNIEHMLNFLNDSSEDNSNENLFRCVYASLDSGQRWVTYSLRLPRVGRYFFRLCCEIYEYEEEAVKKPWLANYLIENLQPYEGALFPLNVGLWGLTVEGIEYGLQLRENCGSTVRSENGETKLTIECDPEKSIFCTLENSRGEKVSDNFIKMKISRNSLNVETVSLKVGYYKLILRPALKSKVDLGVFLIVVT